MPKRNLDGTVKAKSPFADGRGSGRSLNIREQKIEDAKAGHDVKPAVDVQPAVTRNVGILDALRIQKHGGLSIGTVLAIEALDQEVMTGTSPLSIKGR